MNRKRGRAKLSARKARQQSAARGKPSGSLFYTTVRLQTFKNNQHVGSGTGFFWHTLFEDGASVISIVTNKHVIGDSDAVSASCHLGTETGRPSGKIHPFAVSVQLDDLVQHPDPEVDLCAIGLSAIKAECQQAGVSLFYMTLGAEHVPSEEEWRKFDSIEEVLMLGCPNGLFDEVNNLPIARRGITATPLPTYSYNGKAEFLVDMACFPGSSGSPIFIYPSKEAARSPSTNGRIPYFFLVGILHAGPTISQTGAIVLAEQPKVNLESMMHLGLAIRSPAMLELDRVIREREAVDAVEYAGLWEQSGT